jgi:hypothetical protein
MALERIELSVSFRWWLTPYLIALFLFAWLHSMQPDPEKLGRVVKAGMVIRVKGSHSPNARVH